jgi:tRNA(Ile)-lysidine synthase
LLLSVLLFGQSVNGARRWINIAGLQFQPSEIAKFTMIVLFAKLTKDFGKRARDFRRGVFQRLIDENKADYIATAHHLGDEAETVLFRLARGTLSGVAGMKEQDGYIIRPLISWTKQEILSYAQENGLSYRVDATNLDTEYTRNKIRLEVLPKLEESVAGAARNIARFAALSAQDDELLYEYAKKLLFFENGGYRVEFNDKKPLFCRACLLAMKGLGIEKDYTATHLDDVFGLQNLERGAKITLPKGVLAEKRENGVFFYQKTATEEIQKPQPQAYTENGFDGGRYEVIIKNQPIKADNLWKVLRFDEEKLPKGAVFRFRQDGDWIRRFGSGKKTLKKFFNEEKISTAEREWLPMLAQADGNEVFAVCGVELSEKIKVDDGTKKAVYIAIRKKE